MAKDNAVIDSFDAEIEAKNFVSNSFGWINIEVQSVDFDGNVFVVKGGRKERTGEIIRQFTVKVSKDGKVVGWETK